jgi:lipid-A-disaccharide synthase
MKYFLVAGEPSGDQHGSSLMRSILKIDPQAEFRFLGGDLMEEVAGNSIIHIRDLAFMGFTQLVIKVLAIKRTILTCQREILAFEPDVVIPIDYGGFNLRLIKWLWKRQFKSVFYITPKVWAWMPRRSFKLARFSEESLCILPFEPSFLSKYGVRAEFVGNPVKEYIRSVRDSDPLKIRTDLGLSEKPVIALLPGSRKQEISKILPVLVQLIDQFKEYQFVIGGHRNFPEHYYHQLAGRKDAKVIYGKTLDLLKVASAALVTSGTATLEAGLIGTPQVVCYKAATLSWLIARLLIKVKHISLVNLILNKPCVEELIQYQFTARNVKNCLERILTNGSAIKQISEGYKELDEILGEKNASDTAAAIVCRVALKT